ncbi:MAG: hemerythrin HHE cation-binding protein [Halothece sp.]
MVATLGKNQGKAIATKLEDMKAIQRLLISNEEVLKELCAGDQEIRDRLQKMLEDDRENLGTIERAITKFGIEAQPQETTQNMIDKIEAIMKGDRLSPYEKAMEHEGLKHLLVMTGLVIHKAAQTVGDEVEKSISPINKVSFKNRAHQEQLKSIVQVLGTRELTGQDPDKSIWGQAEDAIAGLKGIFKGLTD